MVGRANVRSRSPYPSSAMVVNPAVVRGRRSDLPREACVVVPVMGLRGPRGIQNAAQESADGIVGGGNEPERPEASPHRRPERSPVRGG